MELYIVIINFLIFVMGVFFGSFYTLARHRIPRGLDIVSTRSFCPTCNGKLGVKDLCPIFSYIFLGGKCRHCGEKISSKYFFTEIFTGIVFLAFFNSLNFFDISNLSVLKIVSVVTFPFILTYMYLTAKIDQDTGVIDKSLMVFGTMIAGIHVFIKYIYLENGDMFSVYLSIIYLFVLVLLTILQMFNVRIKNNKSVYIVDMLSTILILTIYFEPTVMAAIVGISVMIYLMYELVSILELNNLKNKLDEKYGKNLTLNSSKKEKQKLEKLKEKLLPKLDGTTYSKIEQRRTKTSFILVLMYITLFVIILTNFLSLYKCC